MAHDPHADDGPRVDFVVGADANDVGNVDNPEDAAAGHAPQHSTAADESGAEAAGEHLGEHLGERPDELARHRLPPWLRQRGALAGGAVVLVVLALASRAFASRHDDAGKATRPSASSYSAPGRPGTEPPQQPVGVDGCAYRLQSTSVATLPPQVTAALKHVLPGVEVMTSTTQVGGRAGAGPCVLAREINASDAGVQLLVEIRPAATGDKTDGGSGVGSGAVNFYVDYVGRGLDVHIEASQPYGARGSSKLTMGSLSRLAADPRLVAA